ncbi:His/Gly/Thr/Pro-type tRNA ligase C-terminal domain-containing protein, partial [Gammaproteobacteria bacterium]|nr:His/Gly/Thr/Pro-type tRNA ligase C-terminal domain-containing protein [Gammaproteobacteria bacterium]
HTVFEWVTDSLGAQGTVCGGGRYDGLVEQLGGKANFAAGFSMGCERLVSMLIDQQLAPAPACCDVYLLMRGDNSVARAQQLAESIRDALPGLCLVVHAGAGSFKSQMRKADKSGAKIAIILGESELAAGTVSVKYLREQRDQVTIAQAEIVSRLASLLN